MKKKDCTYFCKHEILCWIKKYISHIALKTQFCQIQIFWITKYISNIALKLQYLQIQVFFGWKWRSDQPEKLIMDANEESWFPRRPATEIQIKYKFNANTNAKTDTNAIHSIKKICNRNTNERSMRILKTNTTQKVVSEISCNTYIWNTFSTNSYNWYKNDTK